MAAEDSLNLFERDFVEFMAGKRNRSADEMEKIFIETKRRYDFSQDRYNALTGDIARVQRIMYDTATQEDAIDCYRAHALLHLFRFISYTYPKAKSKYAHELFRDLKKGEFGNLYNFIKRKLVGRKSGKAVGVGFEGIAAFLADKVGAAPIVVDYGCGLGHASFEIAKLNKKAKIYLVDIDCLTLEFAEFRFRKHDVNVEIIPVTGENMYPELPRHNICIAREVMEHVAEPLVVYQNICSALEAGGFLYGGFEDHEKNMYHISTDLSGLREKVVKDFEKLQHHCYRKSS